MIQDTEQHRIECEAREIAKRSHEQRRMYLNEVEKSRGKDAAEKLRDALRAIWDAKVPT